MKIRVKEDERKEKLEGKSRNANKAEYRKVIGQNTDE
jgi:hypothetical protein